VLAKALIVCLAAAVAAPVAPAAQERRARFHSGIDLISVTATVVDRDGHLVTGLPRDAFEVFEDGVKQPIVQFTSERVPVSLALLLDVSDSMFGQRLVDARVAVERFLFTLLAKDDEFSIVAFNHEPRLLGGWTQSADSLRGPLAALHASGATALYDAVLAAMPLMNGRGRQRAALLIISDGADTASDAMLRDVRSALIRSDAFVYAIAIDPKARLAINRSVDVTSLNEITGGNGGNTIVVHETAELVDATARIAEELNSQYVLAYAAPRPPDGRYRSIRVRVPNSEYLVRARRGYVAARRGVSSDGSEPAGDPARNTTQGGCYAYSSSDSLAD
jgi:Ca-activated chloride channel family protein